MTLTKAVKELMVELQRTDLTEEEKKALEKYKTWLFGVKKTVTNNTEQVEFNKSKVYAAGPSFSEEMLGIIQKKVDEIASQYKKDREQFCRGMLSQALEKQGCFFGQWHPYPQEEPTEGTYLVCCHDADGEVDMAFADYKADRFIGWGDKVFAWAIPPKAYEP